MASATKVAPVETGVSLDKCPNCGQFKTNYKKNLQNAHVLIVRQEGVMIVEQGPDNIDQKETLNTLLEEIGTKVTDNQEVKAASDRLRAFLATGPAKALTIGEVEPRPTEKGKCSIGALLEHLNAFRGCSSTFLPLNSTFYERLPSGRSDAIVHICVISRAPKEVDVVYRGGNMPEPKTYRLSVPFMHLLAVIKEGSNGQYALDINSSFLFLTKQQLSSPEDLIYRFPMNNQHEDGRFCWGTVKVNVEGLNWQRYAGILFNTIFQSVWNDDLAGRGNDIPPEIGNINRWAEMTVNNPYFTMEKEISWRPHANEQKTVSQLLARVRRNLATSTS